MGTTAGGTRQFLARNYGVLADGLTNDTPALKRATAAVFAAGGGDLILPGGTLRLGQDGTSFQCWNLQGTNLRVRGQGIGRTIIQKDPTLAGTPGKSVSLVNILGSAIEIEGCSFDGNRQSIGFDTNYEHQAGFFVQGSSNIIFRDVESHNCGGDGIQLYAVGTATTDIRITGCRLHDNNRQGISMTSGDISTPVADVLLSECRIYQNQVNQIDSEPGGTGITSEVRIVGCRIDIGTTLNHAISLGAGYRWAVTGNYIRGEVSSGLSQDLAIAGNYIEDCTEGGGAIFLYEKHLRATITGNVLRSTHAIAGAGCMHIEAIATAGQKSAGIVVANNVIDCSAAPTVSYGVLVKHCYDVIIEGNTIIGPGLAAGGNGIHLRALDPAEAFRSAVIKGNRVRDFGGNGLAIAGNGLAQILYVNIDGNTFEDTANVMHTAIDLNSDATGALVGFDVVNNRILGAGIATMIAHTPGGSTALIAATATNTGWLTK